MTTIITFPDETRANNALKEIGATPAIEGEGGEVIAPVVVWFEFEASTNTVAYARSQDGRVAIAHPFHEAAVDWLEENLLPSSGFQILESLPGDWQPVIGV